MNSLSVEPTKLANLNQSHSSVKKEPEDQPKPGPQNSLLEPFLGQWRMEGTFGESEAIDDKNKATGEESYEWMPGGFFLQYRWDRDFGGKKHKGIGIFKYDEKKQKYFAHFFDNLGYARIYEVEIKQNSFSLSGESERATIAIKSDDNSMSIVWEQNKNGVDWRPLCNLKAELIGSARSTIRPM